MKAPQCKRVVNGVLLRATFAAVTPLCAQPGIKVFGPPITGHVTNGRTTQPAAGALVYIYLRGQNLSEARTDANGDFRITGLPIVETNNGAATLYMLIARLPESKPTVAPVAVPIPPASGIPVQVELPEAEPMRVKITDTKGEALTNAVVTAPKLWVGNGDTMGAPIAWEHLGLPISGFNITEADGTTTIPNLPQACP